MNLLLSIKLWCIFGFKAYVDGAQSSDKFFEAIATASGSPKVEQSINNCYRKQVSKLCKSVYKENKASYKAEGFTMKDMKSALKPNGPISGCISSQVGSNLMDSMRALGQCPYKSASYPSDQEYMCETSCNKGPSTTTQAAPTTLQATSASTAAATSGTPAETSGSTAGATSATPAETSGSTAGATSATPAETSGSTAGATSATQPATSGTIATATTSVFNDPVPPPDTLNDRMNAVILEDVTNDKFCSPPQKTTHPADCRESPEYHKKYRTMDGSCNNEKNVAQGSAFTPLKRWLPANYEDGFGAITGAKSGSLPVAREASRLLLRTEDNNRDPELNQMVMQWGQFLSHDLSRTKMLPNKTCTVCGKSDGLPCMDVGVSSADPFKEKFTCVADSCCIRLSRSSPTCGTENGTVIREQYNEHTSYIDAGMVYGNSEFDLNLLREPNSGRLISETFNGLTGVLPFNKTTCLSQDQCPIKFKTGDGRIEIFLGLIAMHFVMFREHNRLVDKLSALNPSWDSETLFQEARKIVGAEVAVVTYNEYLPRILGSKSYAKFIGSYNGYDPNVDATVTNVFATSAFRFAHGQIANLLRFDNSSTDTIFLNFTEVIFHPDKVLFNGGVDAVVNGLILTPARVPDTIHNQVADDLFAFADLGALDIQRCRDHGLPGYNAWREFCGLSRVTTFEELAGEITRPGAIDTLKSIYAKPDDIDIFVGQTIETPLPGSTIGPTGACLMGKQFANVRNGDRLWYEADGTFTKAQSLALSRVTLARILCDNGDKLTKMARDAFRFIDKSEFVSCDAILELDLQPWKV